MTDKEFRKQRKRVRKAVADWRQPLGLEHWLLHLQFERGPYNIDGAVNDRAVASCSVLWNYREATMTFNLAKVAGLTKDELDSCVVHEAMHVHLRELRDNPELEHEERVATSLAWVALWCRGRPVA